MDISQVMIQHQQVQVIKHDLARPLLIAQAEKGILACAYINPTTCDKTGEACAIVSGVSTFDDMVAAKVVAVSQKAAELGIKIGDTGQSALEKMR
jgi:uncharacterized protein YunC (DUF1805 family)